MREACAVFACLALSSCGATVPAPAPAREGKGMRDERIRVCEANPRYWQYRGRPVMLLGGSVEDNLFQVPDLREHLDLLRSAGGNYVRCTMSSRDEGNEWPFARVGDRYDLDRWNDEYWRRFAEFLALTAERDIIVQIELWATFDYYRGNWDVNPFNPAMNVNYTAEASGLPTVVKTHPVKTDNCFFWSVPKEGNREVVLEYQRRFVDKVLSYSLARGHVLYCMDNETSVTPAWGEHWARHVRRRAGESGVHVEVTEMWDKWDLFHEQHKATVDHPETYSFCDASQNNHQRGEKHWANGQRFRSALSPVRPVNNVKVYGADGGRHGTARNGLESFWRNVLGGMASARFHRPPSGIGLSDVARAHLKSARMLTDRLDIFACEPSLDVLSDRRPNGAYATANPGREYAVYFPNGDPVEIDLSAARGSMKASWLDIARSTWAKEEEELEGGGKAALTPPGRGHWAVVIRR